MALTFTTGMTMDQNATAETATNWSYAKIAGGNPAPSSSLDTSVFKQGAASMAMKVAVGGQDSCLLYDYYTDHTNAVCNLASKYVAVWALCTSVGAIETLASGGMYILLSSSADTGTTAPTKYAKWTIGGSNSYPGGWVRFLIDLSIAPTSTAGGWVAGTDLAITRRMGVGIKLIASPPTIKAENMYVDAFAWGTPLYKVVGDGSTVCTWADFLANAVTAANGYIEDLGGAYSLSFPIRFGDSAQANTTTFTDATGTNIIWKRRTYYNGAAVADIITYSSLYVIDAQGAAAKRTAVTIGSVVGTGANRQGVLGGQVTSADVTNITWKMDFQTDKGDLSAVNLYGVRIKGAKGGILLNNDATGVETNIISCQFINCGEIDTGVTGSGATVLSCALINPSGGTSANRGILIHEANRVTKLACITSGSPATQHLVRLSDLGTYTVAFDGIEFFGDYSSGTLWNGENSANNANTVTVSSTNAVNPPVASEFEDTGATPGTVTVSNDVTLTVHVVDEGNTGINGARCFIAKSADGTVLLDATTANVSGVDGIAKATYNYTGSTPIAIAVRDSSAASPPRYVPFSSVGAIDGVFTLTVVLYVDGNLS